MSFNNLYKKHEGKFAAQTIALRREIDSIVNKMNLKVFRNKYVGHFGLDENLGQNKIAASITNNELKNLLGKSQKLINMIITDAGLRPKGHSLAYYTEIPEKRSTSVFLNRLYEKKQIQN